MTLENTRRNHHVLVPEAHALGAIAVVRSLGRAGYHVHACSFDPDALGLKSNFGHAGVVNPRYEDDTFIPWLRAYIRDHEISAIVPSEGFLHAIHPHFEEFCHLMPIPRDREVAYAAFSKIDVTKMLTTAPQSADWQSFLPPSMVVERGEAAPSVEDIRDLGAPFFLKGDARDHRCGHDALIQRLETPEAARAALVSALADYDAVLLQGWVGGVKAAVSLCLDHDDGSVISESGVIGLRTTPHQGGMMTSRESWRHDKMREVAEAWLRHMGWRGVAMVECKWDPDTDRFWLIEINARYWGYLHLDLFSGVDMPRIQMDRFFGLANEIAPKQELGVRCRHTLPGDASFLVSLLKDPVVGWRGKLSGLMRFVIDFADFGQRSDLLFPGDRHLYWRQAGRYFVDMSARVWRRLRFGHRMSPSSEILKPAE